MGEGKTAEERRIETHRKRPEIQRERDRDTERETERQRDREIDI